MDGGGVSGTIKRGVNGGEGGGAVERGTGGWKEW